MTRIQILELEPVETSIEDLSDDATGNITGGGAIGDFVQQTIREALGFALEVFKETVAFCATTDDPIGCLDEAL